MIGQTLLCGVAAALLSVGVAAAAADSAAVALDAGEWGHYELWMPAQPPRELALWLAGGDPTGADMQRAVRVLNQQGYAVAVIDSREFLARVDGPVTPGEHPQCLDLAAPLQWTAQMLQRRRLGFDAYRATLLIGDGTGAGLAYAALAQVPAGTFAGAIGIDITPQMPLRRSLCERNYVAGSAAGRQLLASDYPLGGWWMLATRSEPSPAQLELRAGVMAHSPGSRLPVVTAATFDQVIDRVLRQMPSAGVNAGATAERASIADIPVVEVNAHSGRGIMALIYSGDGGWRDIDKRIGDYLAGRDIAVLGVDALRYFWQRRDPATVARDLGRLLDYYRAAWGIDRVVLIGYSFGADILPFAYNGLADTQRRAVRLVGLLAPGLATDFEVHVGGWLGVNPGGGALKILPEARRIGGDRLQCIYGADEQRDSLCPKLTPAEAQVTAVPGGHHFDNDYMKIGQILFTAITQRAGQ